MGFFAMRPKFNRKLMYARLAMLVPLLIATFLFHISGTLLVAVRIARIALFVAIVVVAGWLERRRGRSDLVAH